MDLVATANSIYAIVGCDAAAVAQLRAEARDLALSLATDPDAAFELTSSTTNGQTFSGKRTSTNGERLELLKMVIWAIDNGQPYPTRTRAVF